MTEEERPTSRPVDEILDLLADPHRRAVLAFLAGAPEQTATVDEVLDRLGHRVSDQPGMAPDRRQLTIAFHHKHLPKLTDAGVIEYEPDTGLLCYWSDPLLEDLLERIRAGAPA